MGILFTLEIKSYQVKEAPATPHRTALEFRDSEDKYAAAEQDPREHTKLYHRYTALVHGSTKQMVPFELSESCD
jgi:hypothetical protein